MSEDGIERCCVCSEEVPMDIDKDVRCEGCGDICHIYCAVAIDEEDEDGEDVGCGDELFYCKICWLQEKEDKEKREKEKQRKKEEKALKKTTKKDLEKK